MVDPALNRPRRRGHTQRAREAVPPGTFMERNAGRVAAIAVDDTGRSAILSQHGELRRELAPLVGVKSGSRPWISRIRLTEGTKLKALSYAPGEYDLVSCGTVDGFGPITDLMDVALATVAGIGALLAFPWPRRRYKARTAQARELRQGLQAFM